MMDINDIQRLLPHRYPFLLVDRVVEIVPGQKLVAYKNVTANESFFNGHFPGHPVMPGVLILEALAQASAILAYKSENIDPTQKVTYLMGVDGARFRKPVLPGDRVLLTIEVIRHKGRGRVPGHSGGQGGGRRRGGGRLTATPGGGGWHGAGTPDCNRSS
jgi:3-hydroxyacyl-[acyl-carrier-protein] dehydratase